MIREERELFSDLRCPISVSSKVSSVTKRLDVANSEIHEALEIKVFYEGSATLMIGNETLVASAGDVIVMNPYEFHATIHCEEERGKYHLIMVGLDYFASLTEPYVDLRSLFFSEKKAFVNRISDFSELFSLLEKVVREEEQKLPMYQLRVRAMMLEVLSLLMRYGMKNASNKENEQRIRYYRMIEPSLQRIREDYKSELPLSELADACCVNKYYFCRVFKLAMGCSPMQYLCDYRLNRADILLRNTGKSVSEILLDCGFKDESYFYRCYRKHFGMTPKERRKNT